METARLGQLQVVLQETDPKALLKRGYSMVTDEKGRVIQSVTNLQAGDAITIVMSDGTVASEVKRVAANS
jgi:exodeoxyribonuclease VII large subunit